MASSTRSQNAGGDPDHPPHGRHLRRPQRRRGRSEGSLLEGFVVGELRAQQEWADADYRLFHWRDRSGKEVDAVIELTDGSAIALEVKSARSLTARSFTGLDFLRERLGERLHAGIVLAPLDAPLRYAPGLWGLPVSVLWR